MMAKSSKWAVAGACALALAIGAPALASTWVGENGVVRLSFTSGDTLQSVAAVAPGEGGVTVVDLWAYLDEVEPMQRGGTEFLAIGGFELKLVVDGAEAQIVKQEIPFPNLNIGQEPGLCVAGVHHSQRLTGGRLQLVHWQVLFAEPPRNVRFVLDPAALRSCDTMPGCAGTGTFALYSGAVDADQVTDLVGAGCAPAYLNWDGEPDLAPLRGKDGWRDRGVYAPAKLRQ